MDKIKEKFGVKGFSVEFSQSLVEVPEAGTVLKFDRVISNVDSCYNTSSGVFTAPLTGIYSFYFSGVSATDNEHDYADLAIERRKNDGRPFGPVTRVYLRAYGNFLGGCQGSNSIRLKLERGEQIHVRHTRGDLVLKGCRHTRFSGVLEYEYTDNV